RVHADKLKELRPDVIVTQTQCEVCAVSQRDVEEAVGGWLEGKPQVVSLAPNALADVWADIERVAKALGVPERGRQLVGRLKQCRADIGAKARTLRERRTVACIEWVEPLMAAGNWVPELVAMAGSVDLFGTAGQHAPGMTWDQLRQRDPDVIVVMPCGLDLARTRRGAAALAPAAGWDEARGGAAARVG